MYCAVADLLGFTNIVENLSGSDRDARVREWTKLCHSVADEHSIDELRLISDTLFAGTAQTHSGLVRLIEFACTLLEQGLERALPIRGAIALGDVSWGEITYGPGIIEAYRLGQGQNWIGISCADNLDGLTDLWDWSRVCVYPVPLKHGPIRLRGAVVWDIPSIEVLASQLTRKGLSREGETLTWPWAEKIQNTALFRSYVSLARRLDDADPSNFHGFVPAQLIEQFVGALRPDEG